MTRAVRPARPWMAAIAAMTALIGAIRLGASGAAAADKSPAGPTFAAEVAPLVYAHCTTCHREGEAAPFPLLTYQDAKSHAKRIADVTGRRLMPPWKPTPGCGPFVGDRRLTDAQVDLLRRWVDAGCPEGDPKAAPAPPSFPAGWRLGEPDMVVTMPEAYEVPAEGRDIYRCFVIPISIPPGKYIKAVEYRPGNRRVVHHAVLTMLPKAEAKRLLAAEPAGTGPGFATGLAAPGERLPGSLGIWVPGWDPLPLPEGFAAAWPNECDLALQLHLHPDGKAETEKSTVGFYFTDRKPDAWLKAVVLLNKDVDIAPGDGDYHLNETKTLKYACDAIGIFPHMHLLGRTVTVTATLPDGSAQRLLSIADWDFRWQGYYQFARPVHLPVGTRLDTVWTFDNSASNPANPSTPPRRVRFGEQTTDEMGAIILDVVKDAPAKAAAAVPNNP